MTCIISCDQRLGYAKDVLKLDDAYGFNKSMKECSIFGKRTSSLLLRAADMKTLLFLDTYMHSGVQTVGMPWVGWQVADNYLLNSEIT